MKIILFLLCILFIEIKLKIIYPTPSKIKIVAVSDLSSNFHSKNSFAHCNQNLNKILHINVKINLD